MRYSLLLLSMLTGIMVGCKSEKIDLTGPGEVPGQVSFSEDIQPIFQAGCSGAGCHISGETSGVRLSSYQAVINSEGVQYGRKIVDPGNADNSPLVDKIEPSPEIGQRMPLAGQPLNATQIELIRTWIEQGANNN